MDQRQTNWQVIQLTEHHSQRMMPDDVRAKEEGAGWQAGSKPVTRGTGTSASRAGHGPID